MNTHDKQLAATAQEAVAKVGSDHFRSIVDWLGPIPPPNTLLYAAPVFAAPPDLIERCREILAWQRTGVLTGDALRAYANAHWPDEHDPLQIAEKETAREAFRILAKAAAASTPAAPGIDLYPIRCALQYAAAAARENTHTEMAEGFDALIRKIDASPKTFQPTRTYSLDILGNPMRQYEPGKWESARWPSDASPKGGSDVIERIAALLYQEATDEPWTVAGVEHDGPDRAYYRELARRVLEAEQAGDAEVQP